MGDCFGAGIVYHLSKNELPELPAATDLDSTDSEPSTSSTAPASYHNGINTFLTKEEESEVAAYMNAALEKEDTQM